jgi:hypothetical protein
MVNENIALKCTDTVACRRLLSNINDTLDTFGNHTTVNLDKTGYGAEGR